MSLQVIPLNSSPNQSFTVQLVVDSKPLTLNVALKFDEMASYWILSIADSKNNLLIDSVPMLVGSYPAANLLEQQKYLNIGSWYLINISNLVSAQLSSYGYGEGGYGSIPYGGDAGLSGIDWADNNNLGSDFQLWVDDTPPV